MATLKDGEHYSGLEGNQTVVYALTQIRCFPYSTGEQNWFMTLSQRPARTLEHVQVLLGCKHPQVSVSSIILICIGLENKSKLLSYCCCWVLRHFETSEVISVASDIEREKTDKFCSLALISAWGSFTCRKSTTRDPRLYFPSEGSHTQDVYALKKSIDPGRDRISEPRIQRRLW